ncbi:hypothetical protein GCM10011514_38070 [Emticicia aquatilis]|uniref:ATP-dependent exonuclease SbcCD, C subunit-like protein n=1 Tax=Emticicia aquatilis TaxID=1537369 RepID=A0A917DU13_9BACT|nr:ATP-binding protein [Emticicia aquatilis]GGD70379.1 hypothetical protein GCM10011514_38070 [Emticicia aquatilis]
MTPNTTDETLAGYRLHRFEVQNWGTFDKKIWKISPNGFNALVTGDIGSGKSTLIDGLTTLLVSTQKITYNKAAGAETRERNLKSYILGAYKGEKVDFSSKSKPITLRKVEDGTYSVLLASFYNEYYKSYCTIVQIFWLKSENESAERLFIIAENDLSIATHFQNFNEIRELKKRLKETKSVEFFDSFKEYSSRFRQIVGIKSDEALDLFYQTVSMKQVSNLTEFVRTHMLSKTNVEEEIKTLLERFENLDAAHKAILKAKRQLELLTPIIEDLAKYDEVCLEIKRLDEILEQIPYYFAYHKSQLLKETLSDAQIDYERAEGIRTNAEEDLKRYQKESNQIRDLITNNEKGKRLEQIKDEVENLKKEQSTKQENEKQYKILGEKIGLSTVLDSDEFFENKKKLDKIASEIEQKQQELRQFQDNILLETDRLKKEKDNLEEELLSLTQRKTQIPDRQLRVRKRILDHFNLDESELPFVGELIKVKESEKEWEGAIERRLNGFGLSLIVADELYNQVSNFINSTNFDGERLVFFRVLDEDKRGVINLSNQSLVRKIEIKDNEFYDWIEQKLANDHNLICCDTIEEFRRTPFAITKEGLIKLGKSRHEKDDRRNIHDRRNFILGWTNTQKINLLEKDLEENRQKIITFQGKSNSLRNEETALKQQNNAIIILSQISDYAQLNWQAIASQILQLHQEESELKATSSELETLNAQFEKIGEKIQIASKIRDNQNKILGNIESGIVQNTNSLFNALNILGVIDKDSRIFESFFDEEQPIMQKLTKWLEALDKLSIENEKVTPENDDFIRINLLENREIKTNNMYDLEDKTNKKITASRIGLKEIETEKKNKLAIGLNTKMRKFKDAFPSETHEFDVNPEPKAAKDYIDFYTQIKENDLPKHEKWFKDELSNKTIGHISIFRNNLERQEKEIEKKIGIINDNLKEIDYNKTEGTYIRIDKSSVQTNDIIDFKIDLRNCLSNILGQTESNIEKQFESVKKILVRFQKTTDEDKKWTEKVTDVREWFTFGAEELYREDDTRRDYFSDSSGKSGGQKEKLAYTILASAITYQFGLRWDGQPKTFRLVVIDEAFGRGSDDSTRYGLELFKKMNLQLLIVTPLQKINIIEDYINAVHFVANQNGQYSSITNLTKKEYLENKELYAQSARN